MTLRAFPLPLSATKGHSRIAIELAVPQAAADAAKGQKAVPRRTPRVIALETRPGS
jgi:hypothetical protein